MFSYVKKEYRNLFVTLPYWDPTEITLVIHLHCLNCGQLKAEQLVEHSYRLFYIKVLCCRLESLKKNIGTITHFRVQLYCDINGPIFATKSFSLCTSAIADVTPTDRCSSIFFNLSTMLLCNLVNWKYDMNTNLHKVKIKCLIISNLFLIWMFL